MEEEILKNIIRLLYMLITSSTQWMNTEWLEACQIPMWKQPNWFTTPKGKVNHPCGEINSNPLVLKTHIIQSTLDYVIRLGRHIWVKAEKNVYAS